MNPDRSFSRLNDEELEALRALISRLSPEQLAHPIGHEWTVASGLAHLGFWDRRALGQLEDWERTGVVDTSPTDADAINAEHLAEWRAMDPQAAARGFIAAAEALDAKLALLSDAMVEKLLAAGRERTLNRSNHRRAHRLEIEAALG